jgi:hypothetical protein
MDPSPHREASGVYSIEEKGKAVGFNKSTPTTTSTASLKTEYPSPTIPIVHFRVYRLSSPYHHFRKTWRLSLFKPLADHREQSYRYPPPSAHDRRRRNGNRTTFVVLLLNDKQQWTQYNLPGLSSAHSVVAAERSSTNISIRRETKFTCIPWTLFWFAY